jgi:TolB-like protein
LALSGVLALMAGAWWVGRSSGAGAGPPNAAESSVDPVRDDVLRIAYADLSEDARPTIAVLPFIDLTPAGDQRHFTDGMTEEILNALAKIREIRVSGRTSSFAYRDQERDLREIGAEMGVRYLVEGSLRQQGERRRITAQLIDATGDFHLWSETYDYQIEDVFLIQEEIAEAVAEQLQVSLGLADGKRLVAPATDLDAYDLYLLGRSKMRERGPGVSEARDLFERATRLDPEFAPAWAGLALAQSLVPFYYPPNWYLSGDAAVWESSLRAAEEAALRALSLDPDNVAAEVALGSVYRDRWNWEKSEAHFLRALALDPDDPDAHQQYGEMLVSMGRKEEGLRSTRRALELDRTAVIRMAAHCGYLTTFGEYEEALPLCEAMVAANPSFPAGSLRLLRLYLSMDDVDSFLALAGRLRGVSDLDPDGLFKAAWEQRDSEAVVALVGREWSTSWVFVHMGDTARAIAMAEQRLLHGLPYHGEAVMALWEIEDRQSMTSDPRFTELLERVGLTQ